MKILIVSQYYLPEQFLINEIAPELVKRGHEVTVLTGLPNYPDGIIPAEYRHDGKREETVDGVSVIRCGEIGRRGGAAKLLLNYVSFAVSGCRKAKGLKPGFDVILSYQLSPVAMAAPAVRYKKKHGTPLLLYCLDLWPESAQAHVHNDRGLLYKWICSYSKRLYNACDRIAVTSEPFIDYMRTVNRIAPGKLCYIPQHADAGMLDMDIGSEDNGIADFMFAGNLGKGQKTETLLKAAALLKNEGTEGFVIHIVGDGSRRRTLEQAAKNEGVAELIIFHGQQQKSDMPSYYKKADALLLTLRGDNFVGNTMPGKLQAYMTAGKPVFGAINGAARQVIEKSGCGACVPAEDFAGLAGIMKDYICNPEKYRECGEKARNYFKKHFTLPVFMDRLENELTELAVK